MENKNKYLILIFVFISVIIITGTFAWLTYSSKRTGLALTIGDIHDLQITLRPYTLDRELVPSLTYDDSDGYISVDAVNNSSSDNNFQLYFKIDYSSNQLLSEDLKYTILKSTDGGNTYTEYNKGIGNFSTANTYQNFIILDEIVPASTTYKYKVCIWLSDNGEEQNGLENTRFNADLRATIGGPYANLKSLSNTNFYRENAYKTKITDVHFIYDKDLPSGITTNYVKKYDLGANASKPVTGSPEK